MLDFEQTDGIAGLRDAFEAHGYLRPEAAAVLGVPFGTEPRRLDMPLYLRRLDPESPLHTLVRLFALQLPASSAPARAALAPLGLEDAQALGVVELRDGLVLPRVGFVASEGLVVARDMPVWGSEDLRSDHVVGLNPPALLLARLTVRQRARRALDLGCGGGFQSLLAARNAERVVGVDLNPRAVAFARFNARLNGVANVEFREGDLFEPVAGERFELVVCNPPYVVSPETQLLFRDGGRAGDAFCREVVAGAARHLAPGGFATVVVNWIAREGAHWSEPLREWVRGSGCDAWLLHLDTSDALTYAAAWNREGDVARYEAALERWMAYYARNDIRSIGMGAVVLRRSEGREPWVSALELPSRPRGEASAALLEAFAAQDRLAELPDEGALFAARFRVSPQLRVAQVAAMKDGRFEPAGSELQLAGALPFAGQADAGTLRLLQLTDGRRTLGEIVAELAGREVVSLELRRSVGETARRLLALGFLAPAEEAGGRRGHGMAVEFQPEARTAAPRAAGGRGPRRPRRGQAGLGPG